MISFFKSKLKTPEINFSSLHTDIHSHLIPLVDDGAQEVSQSIALIKFLLELGFKKIVTTPHVMMDTYRNTKETIYTGLDIVREEVEKGDIDVVMEAAAEYFLDEDFESKLEKDDMLVISKQYLLFELPFNSSPLNLFDIISKVIAKGYTPLLAHPERYAFLHHSIKSYQRIKDAGCDFQLNTISLTGYYGKQVRKAAELLVDGSLIDFLGSDMHNLKHAHALRNALQEPYVYKLLTDYPLKNSIL